MGQRVHGQGRLEIDVTSLVSRKRALSAFLHEPRLACVLMRREAHLLMAVFRNTADVFVCLHLIRQINPMKSSLNLSVVAHTRFIPGPPSHSYMNLKFSGP